MPRGRPRKIKPIDPNNPPNDNQIVPGENKEQKEVKQKRKYTKRGSQKIDVAYDGDTGNNNNIKPEGKKRGRKRGRKKRNAETMFKVDDVIDYMIRRYPFMGIDKIKDEVITGIGKMRELVNSPYLLYKFNYNDKTYYYDETNTVVNTDGQTVGYIIKKPDGTNKLYMIDNNFDNRTYEQVIDDIEGRKKNTDRDPNILDMSEYMKNKK